MLLPRPIHLDPRVKSFLTLNELTFEPYDVLDRQDILWIRVERALVSGALDQGMIEKIAAMGSRGHGDARQVWVPVFLMAICAGNT